MAEPPEKVLHLDRLQLADEAELLSRRPTGFKEVTREPVLIRESGKWIYRNKYRQQDGQVWWCEKYYVQVVEQGLRDYGTKRSRSRGFIVGTNVRFFKCKFIDGIPEEYDYGLEFPLTPGYQENDTPQKRPAMRIELGTKLVGGERAPSASGWLAPPGDLGASPRA